MTFYPQKNGTFSSDIKFFLFTGWTNAMFLRWLRFGWLSRKVLQSFFFFFLNYLVNDLQERTYLWFEMRKNDEMATKFKWRVIFNKVFHLISNPRRNNRRLKLQRAIATQLIHFSFLCRIIGLSVWYPTRSHHRCSHFWAIYRYFLIICQIYLISLQIFLFFFKFMFSHSKYNYTLRWLSFGFSYRFFKNSITFIIFFLSEMCFLLCLL